MRNKLDLAGQRFRRLFVVREASRATDGQIKWFCRCDCGAELDVKGGNLRSGNSQSCGCLKRELARDRHLKHGMTGTDEYNIWEGIIKRCLGKPDHNFGKYGARGITICNRWRDFKNFYADMGPRPSLKHSIDRINNDGNYEPGNCRWATAKEQARNRRNSRYITIDGVTLTLAEWAEVSGIRSHTIAHRIDKAGWSAAVATSRPPRI